jgi:hypothetical protein
MRFYLKYLLLFLKAASISLLFGASWAITFYGFDHYAHLNIHNYKNDYFLEIINFFFSGIIGALLFFCIMYLFEKLYNSLHEK